MMSNSGAGIGALGHNSKLGAFGSKFGKVNYFGNINGKMQ